MNGWIASNPHLKGANRVFMSSSDSMQNCHWRKENYSSRDLGGRVIYGKSYMLKNHQTHVISEQFWTAKLAAGGKPSTRFPPGGLVETANTNQSKFGTKIWKEIQT